MVDVEDLEDILENEFADELKLGKVVNNIVLVYQCIYACPRWERIEDHMSYLKYVLKETTKVHDQFHSSHLDWRNKLSVIHCRRPLEATFVTAIWDLILAVEKEFFPDDTSADSDMRTLLDEVLDTAEECGIGARSFPIGHLVPELEYYSWDMGANPEKVQAALISLDIPFNKLYAVYRRLNFIEDDDDDDAGLPSHHLKAFASLIQSFIRKYNILNMDYNDRQSILHQCKADVEKHLNEMYTNKEYYTSRLIQRYENLQYSLGSL